MRFPALAFTLVCFASACQASVPTGEDRAEQMVVVARTHLGVDDLKKAVGTWRDMKQVAYESAMNGRFATYYLTSDDSLKEFVVNQPSAASYAPIKNRLAFIERMMEIVAPESSKAERAWGAYQLDSLWKKPLRPLPVQVGGYVFK
jgi:hypothetical protein